MKNSFPFLTLLCLSSMLCTAVSPALAARKVAVEQVVLSEHSLHLWAGESADLTATVLPENADNKAVVWSTLKPEAPIYCFEGHVYSLGAGTQYIVVKTVDGEKTDTCVVTTSFRHQGQCGDHLYWTINAQYRLDIWADKIGEYRPADSEKSYRMWDYSSASPAPWYEWRDSISEIGAFNADTVGNSAFRGLSNVFYLRLPEEGVVLRDSVFWGCTHLFTIEDMNSAVTALSPTSLRISDTQVVGLLLVGNKDMLEAFRSDPLWSADHRVIMPNQGEWGDIRWWLGQSDSLRSLKLQIDYNFELVTEAKIPDIDTTILSARAPWHDLRGYVEDLKIGGKVTYLGKNAFASLSNLQTITIIQSEKKIDSLHYDAFSHTITPWKFAMGDDSRSGSDLPPKIIGMTDEPDNFAVKTVLYVPDSLHVIGEDSVKTIHLYANAPFWRSFNTITDRTVSVSNITSSSAVLRWYPLEFTAYYRLWINKVGCTDCDTSIIIPANGGQGLIDWVHNTIPSYIAARRLPKDDDGQGGTVLSIKMKLDGGTAANKEVEVQSSGMQADTEYQYRREAYSDWGEMSVYTKEGIFRTLSEDQPSALPDTPSGYSGTPAVYDMMGRKVGTDLTNLPRGVYIIDNGQSRTTCVIAR